MDRFKFLMRARSATASIERICLGVIHLVLFRLLTHVLHTIDTDGVAVKGVIVLSRDSVHALQGVDIVRVVLLR